MPTPITRPTPTRLPARTPTPSSAPAPEIAAPGTDKLKVVGALALIAGVIYTAFKVGGWYRAFADRGKKINPRRRK